MVKYLETVEEVITELGGYKRLAQLTERGASVSLVANWKYRKLFPAKTYAVLQDELRKHGATAPNSLWGMP
jgi:hypothetical protein